jgi:hypothetical protein
MNALDGACAVRRVNTITIFTIASIWSIALTMTKMENDMFTPPSLKPRRSSAR